MTQKQISQTEFTSDVQSGMTRKELSTKYGASIAIINEAAKRWELTIAIKKTPKYVFVDDAKYLGFEEATQSSN